MSGAHALPPEGVDLNAEVASLQRRRIEQALERSNDDAPRAARLLRLSLAELERLRSLAPGAPGRGEVSRVEGGVELVSRAAIRRLCAEGFTPKQIARRFGVHEFFVEKVMRGDAELAKCPATPARAARPARSRRA